MPGAHKQHVTRSLPTQSSCRKCLLCDPGLSNYIIQEIYPAAEPQFQNHSYRTQVRGGVIDNRISMAHVKLTFYLLNIEFVGLFFLKSNDKMGLRMNCYC